MPFISPLPLGEVLELKWRHKGREDAAILLEQAFPHRLNFISYNADGSIESESGWHGRWFRDTSTATATRRGRVLQGTGGHTE